MKIANKIKRDTLVVIISVFVLTFSTMRVAYSAIFSVKSMSTVQQISSGTLNVVIDNLSSEVIDIDELFPTSSSSLPTEENSIVTGNYATLVLNNTGTLNSAFSVSIGYDTLPEGKTTDDLISFDYLIVGIYDVTEDKWVQFGSTYNTIISALEPSELNTYPILNSTINAQTGENPTVKQYRIYIWLKEDTPTSEIGKLAYLKLNVKSTTVNDGVHS